MRVTVTKNDLQPDIYNGFSHPIANALSRTIGGYWAVSKGGRLAYEIFPPSRIISLPECVSVFLQAWRSEAQVEPFSFEIPDEFAFTGEPAAADDGALASW